MEDPPDKDNGSGDWSLVMAFFFSAGQLYDVDVFSVDVVGDACRDKIYDEIVARRGGGELRKGTEIIVAYHEISGNDRLWDDALKSLISISGMSRLDEPNSLRFLLLRVATSAIGVFAKNFLEKSDTNSGKIDGGDSDTTDNGDESDDDDDNIGEPDPDLGKPPKTPTN